MPDAYGNPLPGEFSNAFGQSQQSPLQVNTGLDQGILNNVGNPIPGGVPAIGGQEQEGGIFSNFFSNDQGGQGYGTAAIGAVSGAAQTFLGFNQLSEGRKQNRIAQNQWQAQFDIQKGELDRQNKERDARIANANAAKAAANRGG